MIIFIHYNNLILKIILKYSINIKTQVSTARDKETFKGSQPINA